MKKTLRALKRSEVYSTTALAGNNNNNNNGAHPPIEQRNIPMSHMRIVIAYMLGSSMLDTEALTSGKGLSLSLMASRPNSILQREKENVLWWISSVVHMK